MATDSKNDDARLSRRSLLVAGSVGGALLATARPVSASTGRAAGPKMPPAQPGRDYQPVVVPNGAKLPWRVVDGVKVFHMVAEEVDHELAPGLKVKCWGYKGRVHGPVIEAVEGDRVRIYVTNRLPAATSSWSTEWMG